MSNIETIEALLSAIEHSRFAEIGSLHNPGATLHSFRGPTVSGGVAISDWYTAFLRDYADCVYVDRDVLEAGDTIALRAKVTAKSVDWRPFEQRLLEVADLADGGIAGRRIYAMPANVEYPKPALDALKKLEDGSGGGPAAAEKAARGLFEAVTQGDRDGALSHLDAEAVLVDGVFGTASGAESVLDLISAVPRPAFGRWRVASVAATASAAAVELNIDPGRPRLACWVRLAGEKVALLEAYWMLREIGVRPEVASLPRHPKQVILPI